MENYSFVEELKRDGNIESLRSLENDQELSGEQAIIQMLFTPGISINGIEGGYYDEGSMTISEHFDKNFPMIDYEFEKGGYESGKIPLSHPLAQTAYNLYKEFNKEVMVLPLLAGSAPFALYQKKLDIPFIVAGIGHSGRAHSPLEYAVIKANKPEVGGIIDFELYIAKLLHKLSTSYKS